MPANISELTAAIDEAALQATKTTNTEDSAGVIISAQGAATEAAVAAALAADNITDQAVIDNATAAVRGVTSSFKTADDRLAAAILANTPAAPPAPSA